MSSQGTEKRNFAGAAGNAAVVAVMAALLTAVKFALSGIPNIEAVSLFIIVYALTLGLYRAVSACLIFSTVEVFLYGINSWVLMYYINWPLLAVLAWLIGKGIKRLSLGSGEITFGRVALKSLLLACLSAVFGFAFGFLCALVQGLFYSGSRAYWEYVTLYWANGLVFDALHAAGNFVLTLFLSEPLLRVFAKIRSMLHFIQ